MDYLQKTAILIQCHTNAQQVNALLRALSSPLLDCYVHVDKKSSIYGQIEAREGVYLLPEEARVNVKWAQISQVDATLNLLKAARARGDYGYYILISGQDWPCKSVEEIAALCRKGENRMRFWPSLHHGGKRLPFDKRTELYLPLWMIRRKNLPIRILKRAYVTLTGGKMRTFKPFRRKNRLGCRFYFGSSWWGLNRETIAWMTEYLAATPAYHRYFRNCANPDESFFQTLLMLSPFADDTTDYLTYLRFLPGANSPEWLTDEDVAKALASDRYFMRKIDMGRLSPGVLQLDEK